MGAGILVEARKGPDGARELDKFLRDIGATEVPFGPEQSEMARIAFRRLEKADIQQGRISEIARHTLWPQRLANRCCSKAMTLA